MPIETEFPKLPDNPRKCLQQYLPEPEYHGDNSISGGISVELPKLIEKKRSTMPKLMDIPIPELVVQNYSRLNTLYLEKATIADTNVETEENFFLDQNANFLSKEMAESVLKTDDEEEEEAEDFFDIEGKFTPIDKNSFFKCKLRSI